MDAHHRVHHRWRRGRLAIFLTIAFAGILPPAALATTIFSQWFFKVTYEVLATPLTYLVVGALKRAENEDYFDRGTNFNPVSLG